MNFAYYIITLFYMIILLKMKMFNRGDDRLAFQFSQSSQFQTFSWEIQKLEVHFRCGAQAFIPIYWTIITTTQYAEKMCVATNYLAYAKQFICYERWKQLMQLCKMCKLQTIRLAKFWY